MFWRFCKLKKANSKKMCFFFIDNVLKIWHSFWDTLYMGEICASTKDNGIWNISNKIYFGNRKVTKVRDRKEGQNKS